MWGTDLFTLSKCAFLVFDFNTNYEFLGLGKVRFYLKVTQRLAVSQWNGAEQIQCFTMRKLKHRFWCLHEWSAQQLRRHFNQCKVIICFRNLVPCPASGSDLGVKQDQKGFSLLDSLHNCQSLKFCCDFCFTCGLCAVQGENGSDSTGTEMQEHTAGLSKQASTHTHTHRHSSIITGSLSA